MKNLKQKRTHYIWKSVLLPMLILGFMVAVLIAGMQRFTAINLEQNRILTEQSICKAAIQCYANEGMYPSDLQYLIDRYYLSVDTDRYYIYYECWASNVMPEIDVYER